MGFSVYITLGSVPSLFFDSFFPNNYQKEDEAAFPAGDDNTGFSLLGDCDSGATRRPPWPLEQTRAGFGGRAEERAEFTPNGDSGKHQTPFQISRLSRDIYIGSRIRSRIRSRLRSRIRSRLRSRIRSRLRRAK